MKLILERGLYDTSAAFTKRINLPKFVNCGLIEIKYTNEPDLGKIASFEAINNPDGTLKKAILHVYRLDMRVDENVEILAKEFGLAHYFFDQNPTAPVNTSSHWGEGDGYVFADLFAQTLQETYGLELRMLNNPSIIANLKAIPGSWGDNPGHNGLKAMWYEIRNNPIWWQELQDKAASGQSPELSAATLADVLAHWETLPIQTYTAPALTAANLAEISDLEGKKVSNDSNRVVPTLSIELAVLPPHLRGRMMINGLYRAEAADTIATPSTPKGFTDTPAGLYVSRREVQVLEAIV